MGRQWLKKAKNALHYTRNEKLCTLYPRNQVPRTLETMHPIPLAQNHVPYTLETTRFQQIFDTKVE